LTTAPTPSDPVAVAVAELQVLVEADGARLDLVDNLSGVECLDCVLPPEALADVVTSSVRRRAGTEHLQVTIEDPRLTIESIDP
jgi:hypothetical protein